MEVLTLAFYAQQDTKTPVIIGTVAMGLNVIFSFMFARLFTQAGWLPVGGLALANSLATALEAAALFITMRNRLQGIEGKNIATGFIQAALATLGMILALVLWIQVTGGMNPWLVGLGGIALGGVVYGLGVFALKVPEIRSVMDAIRHRLLPPPP
jgi:putative peptidoglycan lipid II flippase